MPSGRYAFGSPKCGDKLHRPFGREHVVRVLEGKRDIEQLSGTEGGGAFRDSFTPRLVHIESEDDLIKAVEPFEVGGDSFAGRADAVRER